MNIEEKDVRLQMLDGNVCVTCECDNCWSKPFSFRTTLTDLGNSAVLEICMFWV